MKSGWDPQGTGNLVPARIWTLPVRERDDNVADHEIEFETTDSPHWPTVKLGVKLEAKTRLDKRYRAIDNGAELFRANALELVGDTIKHTPKSLSIGQAFFDGLMAAANLVIPTAGLVRDLWTTTKGVTDMAKAGDGLVTQFGTINANSVEEAQKSLTNLIERSIYALKDSAAKTVDDLTDTAAEAVETYVKENPQPPFQQTDVEYKRLSDDIGVPDQNTDAIQVETHDKLMTPFKASVLKASASLHFLQELDNDVERLEFLIEEAEKGNDPVALVAHIGRDTVYWGHYMSLYKAHGKEYALFALKFHLGWVTGTEAEVAVLEGKMSREDLDWTE